MPKPIALLCLLLFALHGTAHASQENWLEVRSPHFVVITNAGEKQAVHVADQFERMRAVFQNLFPASKASSGAPITVIAAKNKKDFEALEPEAYLAKGQLQLAGWFQATQDKNYIVLRLDAEGTHPFSTVYHEYTHSLMSGAAEWMPLWLNEGLAEFFQNTDIHDKDVELGEPSTDDILYLRQNRLLPLTTLLTVDASSPYYHEEQKGSMFYAESWALTHYLEIKDREAHTHRLQDYALLMSEHVDSVTAARKAFGDLNELQKALQWYIVQGSFKFFQMQAPSKVGDAALTVKHLAIPEADAIRGDFLAHSQRLKDARTLLDGVLKADPNNVLAHEGMGFLEFREGNREAARKWYGEAVKLDSQSYLAHYYFAVMTLMAGVPDQDKEMEASLRTAIKLNPEFAPSYDTLASLYGRRHEKLEEAHLLDVQATELDPSNLNFRLNSAGLLMEAERYADAVRVLKMAEGMAKNPSEVEEVKSRLERVEQFETMQAQNAERARPAARVQPAGDARQSPEPQMASVAKAEAAELGTPRHPTITQHGAVLTATGVIAEVKCAYPTTIELKVNGGGKSLALYNNNYFKVEFSAANFTPEGEMHPCTDLEGKKARVQYAKTSDSSVDGQVVAIEVSR